jgi:SAM-dependent methyltransferase
MQRQHRIDIGCGDSKQPGCIGLDIVPLPGVDIVWNLDQFPYPFKPDTFSEIYMNDVIEHLIDPLKVMEEIHRIAQPDARVHLRVVYWNHRYAYADPTHKHRFTEMSFDFWGKHRRSYYTSARFRVERLDFIFDRRARRWLRSPKLMLFLGHYLCNVIQGIKFELRAVK